MFIDSISNLFSITVNMIYGNTTLQIAITPIMEQLPITTP